MKTTWPKKEYEVELFIYSKHKNQSNNFLIGYTRIQHDRNEHEHVEIANKGT